jgi:hypothetical protein
MYTNITGLIIVLIIFGSAVALISLLYLIFTCYKKIKHRENPIGRTEPFFEISY